jgi:hypothetical protein
MYKHKTTGEYFEHTGEYEGLLIFKSIITGRTLHISTEFLQYYQKVMTQ